MWWILIPAALLVASTLFPPVAERHRIHFKKGETWAIIPSVRAPEEFGTVIRVETLSSGIKQYVIVVSEDAELVMGRDIRSARRLSS